MHASLALLLALVSLFPTATRCWAQPLVRVRAETRIELAIEPQEDLVMVRGALRDDLGAPIGGRAIRVELRQDEAAGPIHASEELPTTADGGFEVRFAREPGRWFVVAAFEGGALYRAQEVVREAQLDRAHVRLDVLLEGGARLDLDRPTHRLTVRAVSSADGAGLSVSVLENDEVLARGVTDEEGNALFELESARLGPASAGRLVVRSEPDPRHRDAQTEVPIIRFRRTRLRMEARQTEVPAEGTVYLSGQLRASSGGLEEHAVGLWAGERHLTTAMTGAGGEFAFQVPIRDLEGESQLIARFQSDAPWWGSSSSDTVTIAVSSGASSPWLGTLVCVTLAAAAVAFSSRIQRPAAKTATDRPRVPPPVALGARRSNGPQSLIVSGTILDRRTDAPIALALIGTAHSEPTGAWTSAADGSFSIELPPGTTSLRVAAPGYERVEHRVSVPHRGEWTGTVIRLRSLRDLGWEALKAPSAQLFPGSDGWGVWTTREIENAARAKGPQAATALRELAREVERICYAATPPTPEEVEGVAARAEEANDALRRIRT